MWHNILFDGSYVLNKLGVETFLGNNVLDILGQSKTAGFGFSVFRDTIENDSRGWVVKPSLVIEGLVSPVSLVYDLYKEYVERQ